MRLIQLTGTGDWARCGLERQAPTVAEMDGNSWATALRLPGPGTCRWLPTDVRAGHPATCPGGRVRGIVSTPVRLRGLARCRVCP